MPESNRMFDLIEPFIHEVQDLETVMQDLRGNRGLDTATGAQLDGIGDIVDRPRGVLTDDEDYRDALTLKNTLNLSSGQAESIIAYVKSFTGGSVEYREPWPGFFTLYITAWCDFKSLRDGVRALAPVGVGFEIYYVTTDYEPFNFADEGGFSSPGAGFLELDYDEVEQGYTAGALVELVS